MPLTPTFEADWAKLATCPAGDDRSWSSTIPPGGNRSLNGPDEAEFYSDASVGVNPFSVSDGVLTITAAPCAPSSNPLGKAYTSGALTTIGLFSQLYGVFEAHIELPQGPGLRPAFWMLPADRQYSSEDDIMEQWQGDMSHVHQTLHGMFDLKAGAVWQTPSDTATITPSGFHRYAVSWRKDRTVFSVDGKETGSFATPASMNTPMFLILNLGIGAPGSWCGTPAAGTVATMRVRDVRAWA